LVECVQAITGKAPSFEMCPGLLETRFYAQQGIPPSLTDRGFVSLAWPQ
jgi:hypothetical protein